MQNKGRTQFSAKQIAADCIITRNKKDFSFLDIPVWTPEEFLPYLQDWE